MTVFASSNNRHDRGIQQFPGLPSGLQPAADAPEVSRNFDDEPWSTGKEIERQEHEARVGLPKTLHNMSKCTIKELNSVIK